MKIEYYNEYSHNLNRNMEYKVFGHAGKPCIAFPCQDKRFYDYENNKMIDIVSSYINEGKIQIFCVDSVDVDTWSAQWKNPKERIQYQECYYRYIIEELIPRVYEINTYGNGGGVASGVMVYGCSMGAYHAMNFFLRRPDVFDMVLSLSGIYHSSFFIKNFSNDLTFLNSPIDSLGMMDMNHPYVDLYKKARICLCVGQGEWEEPCLTDTIKMDELFRRLGICANVEYWGKDIPHDWVSWLKQTPYFFSKILS